MAERQVLSQTDWHRFPQHQSCRLSAGHQFLTSLESRVHQLSSSVSSLSYLVVETARWGDGVALIDWKAVA